MNADKQQLGSANRVDPRGCEDTAPCSPRDFMEAVMDQYLDLLAYERRQDPTLRGYPDFEAAMAYFATHGMDPCNDDGLRRSLCVVVIATGNASTEALAKNGPVYELRAVGGRDYCEQRLQELQEVSGSGPLYIGTVTMTGRVCRVCGCTDHNCSGCIERTGKPCYWIEDDLCSACAAVNAPAEPAGACDCGLVPPTICAPKAPGQRRPPNRPTCTHGKTMTDRCDQCGRGRAVA